jgi:hypothetical protein
MKSVRVKRSAIRPCPPLRVSISRWLNEIDHVVEASASARSDAASGNGDGQMGLAGCRCPPTSTAFPSLGPRAIPLSGELFLCLIPAPQNKNARPGTFAAAVAFFLPNHGELHGNGRNCWLPDRQ